jgi:hypothetical protein
MSKLIFFSFQSLDGNRSCSGVTLVAINNSLRFLFYIIRVLLKFIFNRGFRENVNRLLEVSKTIIVLSK